jgi:hypothetical protein
LDDFIKFAFTKCGISVDEFFELSWYEFLLVIARKKEVDDKDKQREEFEWLRLSRLLTPIYNFMYKRKDGRWWRDSDFMPYKPSWYKEVEEGKEQIPEEDLQARLDKLKEIFPDKK